RRGLARGRGPRHPPSRRRGFSCETPRWSSPWIPAWGEGLADLNPGRSASASAVAHRRAIELNGHSRAGYDARVQSTLQTLDFGARCGTGGPASEARVHSLIATVVADRPAAIPIAVIGWEVELGCEDAE